MSPFSKVYSEHLILNDNLSSPQSPLPVSTFPLFHSSYHLHVYIIGAYFRIFTYLLDFLFTFHLSLIEHERGLCLLGALLYPQHLEQCLLHSKCSVTIGWVNCWTIFQGTNLLPVSPLSHLTFSQKFCEGCRKILLHPFYRWRIGVSKRLRVFVHLFKMQSFIYSANIYWLPSVANLLSKAIKSIGNNKYGSKYQWIFLIFN